MRAIFLFCKMAFKMLHYSAVNALVNIPNYFYFIFLFCYKRFSLQKEQETVVMDIFQLSMISREGR